MALTTSSDVSGCLEVTVGYGNLIRFDSGKFGIEFDSTGGTDERIWGKDPTCGDMTSQVFFLEYVQLASDATGGPISLVDGSGGSRIVTLTGTDTTVVGGGAGIGVWDFRDDPLRCLTADSTQSLCMSSAVKGYCGGFLKGYWGPKGL